MELNRAPKVEVVEYRQSICSSIGTGLLGVLVLFGGVMAACSAADGVGELLFASCMVIFALPMSAFCFWSASQAGRVKLTLGKRDIFDAESGESLPYDYVLGGEAREERLNGQLSSLKLVLWVVGNRTVTLTLTDLNADPYQILKEVKKRCGLASKAA